MKKYLFLFFLSFILFLSACSTSNTSSEKTEDNQTEETDKTKQEEEVVKETKEKEIPFSINDFVLEITHTGAIDSAGGVEYSYNIKNNSPIPVQAFSADVKFEFEDGQTMVETIDMATTIMNGEAIGASQATVYPEPASKIKSYNVVSYSVLDKDGTLYELDLQLETATITEYGVNNISTGGGFNIDDFSVEITPSGEIDSAGGVVYSYAIHNNSPIPAKALTLDVAIEFENGIKLVESISTDGTLMNGDSVGNSNQTTYPEPASKIKSFKLIGYQITDKDDITYNVDTQLKLVELY